MNQLSIIIPVYNAEHTIRKCLDSIFSNSYKDFVILAINDGSVDDSLSILNEYSRKYPDRVKIFSQSNQGVAAARNAGIRYADSEYILFVDDDDWIDYDYLESYIREIETKKADAVFGGYRRTDGKKTMRRVKLKDAPWSKYMVMAPWAKIYRRSFLIDDGIEFLENNIGEDVYFNLQVINLTDKIYISDLGGYNWFYNKGSVSNTGQKVLCGRINIKHLLDSSYEKMKAVRAIKNQYVEYFFLRYIVWYILFTGKKSDSKIISAETNLLFEWLEEKFPNYKKNKNVSLFYPKGETFQNRLALVMFILSRKFKLSSLFLKLYSRF